MTEILVKEANSELSFAQMHRRHYSGNYLVISGFSLHQVKKQRNINDIVILKDGFVISDLFITRFHCIVFCTAGPIKLIQCHVITPKGSIKRFIILINYIMIHV